MSARTGKESQTVYDTTTPSGLLDYDAARTRAYDELVMTELGPHSLVDWQLVNLSTGTHAHGAEVQIWIGN